MAGRWRELFGSDEKRFRSRLAFGQSHAESSSANVARENAPGGEYFNGLLPPRIREREPGSKHATTGMHPLTTRSFALARLRGRREAFLDPRLTRGCRVGDGSGCLITVEVEAERRYDRAGEGHDVKGGGAGPGLVEPQQGAARTLVDVLHNAPQRRDACRNGPTLPGA